MNYQKIYESIIQKVKSENRIKFKKNNLNYVYYESHHIIPKCLGGNNNGNNLILLTVREHYVCYKLLVCIYPHNPKIICAFHHMTLNHKYQKIISSRDYAYARELYHNMPFTEEHKNNMSNALKGKNIGKKRSKETLEKRKKLKINVGEKNGMHGTNMYTIWIERFGKEIADKKLKQRNEKFSISMKKRNKIKRNDAMGPYAHTSKQFD